MIAVTAVSADAASAFETLASPFSVAPSSISRYVCVFDVSHSEAGNRGDDPIDKNDRSEQYRSHYRKSSRIHPSPLSIILESCYGQASHGADVFRSNMIAQ